MRHGDYFTVAIEMQTPARFRREVTAAGVCLIVEGELDFSNHDLFGAILFSLIDEAACVEVDLRGVTFFGSDAMGALILASANAADAGVVFTVINSSYVDKMLEMTGLTGVLAIS